MPTKPGLALRSATFALQLATLYVVKAGTLWAMGHFILLLHGDDGSWLGTLLVEHPWAVAAAMFATCVPVAFLIHRHEARHAAGPAQPARGIPSPPMPSWSGAGLPGTDAGSLHARASALAAGAESLMAEAVATMRAAREAGSSDASHALAAWHARGTGVERDDSVARRYLEEASEAGHALAAFDLGRCTKAAWGDPSTWRPPAAATSRPCPWGTSPPPRRPPGWRGRPRTPAPYVAPRPPARRPARPTPRPRPRRGRRGPGAWTSAAP